uniref:Uncharacterized protein n=1 Tax=Anguilla anguilla TaxID=7936 RepID=A0A0E9RG38_ANGAN
MQISNYLRIHHHHFLQCSVLYKGTVPDLYIYYKLFVHKLFFGVHEEPKSNL